MARKLPQPLKSAREGGVFPVKARTKNNALPRVLEGQGINDGNKFTCNTPARTNPDKLFVKIVGSSIYFQGQGQVGVHYKKPNKPVFRWAQWGRKVFFLKMQGLTLSRPNVIFIQITIIYGICQANMVYFGSTSKRRHIVLHH
jgi:hypothetical protein